MTTLYNLIFADQKDKPDPGSWQAGFFAGYMITHKSAYSWNRSHISYNFADLKQKIDELYEQASHQPSADYYALHEEFKDFLAGYKRLSKKYDPKRHGHRDLYRSINAKIKDKNKELYANAETAGQLEPEDIKIYKKLSKRTLTYTEKKEKLEQALKKYQYFKAKSFDLEKASKKINQLLHDERIKGNDYVLMMAFYNLWEASLNHVKPNVEAHAQYSEKYNPFHSRAKPSIVNFETLKNDFEDTDKMKRYLDSFIAAEHKKYKAVLLKMAITLMIAFITIEPSMMISEVIFEANEADDNGVGGLSKSLKYGIYFANMGLAISLAAFIIGITLYFFSINIERFCMKQELKNNTKQFDDSEAEHYTYSTMKYSLLTLALIESFAFLLLVSAALHHFHDDALLSIGPEIAGPVIGITLILALVCLLGVFSEEVLPLKNKTEQLQIHENLGEELLDPVKLEAPKKELHI